MYSHYFLFSIKEIKAKRGSPRWQVEELGSDARLKVHRTLLAIEDVLKGEIDTADHKSISTLCASSTITELASQDITLSTCKSILIILKAAVNQ